MPTRNVNLSSQQSRFITQNIKTGQYQNASEVVRAALRLLEKEQSEDQLKLERLRHLANDAFGAIDRGEHVSVTIDELDSFLTNLAEPSTAGRATAGKR